MLQQDTFMLFICAKIVTLGPSLGMDHHDRLEPPKVRNTVDLPSSKLVNKTAAHATFSTSCHEF